MAQTSIHICPVKEGSELHNSRRKDLNYVRKELSSQNQSWKSPDYPGIDKHNNIIAADYLAAHGKKMHAKATPIREAVVVIQQDTTMQQLLAACAKCREMFGIEAMQIYTHKDEGHTAEDGTWKPNLHAHIIFNWYDFNTHTTHKLSRQDMSEMQTLFAEFLNMERGVSSDRKHLNAIQQKNQAEAAKLQHLQEQVLQNKIELQQECKDLRKSGTQTVKAFDYLCRFDAAKPTQQELEFRNNLDKECRRDLPTENQALSEYARKLRYYLMNTIQAVTSIGKRLQELVCRIPFIKLHEEAKASKIAKEQAEAREAAANKELHNLQIKIVQARDEGYINGANEQYSKWKEWYNDNYIPTTKELIKTKEELKDTTDDRNELLKKNEELKSTLKDWLNDFRAIGKKLTSLNNDSVAYLEKLGLREDVGEEIWDAYKKQKQNEERKVQASHKQSHGPRF